MHAIPSKEYRCLLCSYITLSKGNLRIHERSHSGVQPYECKVCAMKFSTHSNMAKHVRNIHEKQKSHKVMII